MSYISLSNFSSLRFGAFMKPSLTIEKKLNNSKTTIDDLLIEQDIVQELKNQNQKLIAFLSKERVKELIDYITKEPEEDDLIKGHLFPFTASELLNCEENKILDLFDEIEEDIVEKTRKLSIFSVPENEKEDELFEKTRQDDYQEEDRKSLNEVKKSAFPVFVRIELLDYLLSFLLTNDELNYVLVGYFNRLFSLILSRKPFKVINYLFFERDSLLERFVYHSYRRSISDVLSKMLLFENFEENKEKGGVSDRDQIPITTNKVNYDLEAFKPKRLKVIELIFQKLNFGEQNMEKVENLIAVLSDLIENKAILTSIISEQKIVDSLCGQLKYNTNENETFEVRANYSQLIGFMIKLINNILTFNLQMPSFIFESNTITETILSKGILTTLPFIINNFNIVNKDKLVSFEATFSSQSLQLGNHRVKIMEFIAILFLYFKQIPAVFDSILINSTFFADALDYLVKFEWNNMYQLSFSLLFKNYLNNAKNHEELTKYIFDKQQLLNRIMECLSGGKFKFNSKKEINHGYHSFLVSLSYKINTIGGGESVVIPNHSREGSICFINKTNQENITSITQISNPPKINLPKVDVCDSVNNYLNDSWNNFFLNEIGQTVTLYETRLCEKSFAPSLNDSVRSEEQKEEDIINSNSNNNPFPSKDDNFFNHNDNLVEQSDNSNYEMNSFAFTENSPKEGIEIENLKVDELDPNNYYDLNYWKDALDKSNKDYLENSIKDLGLE